MIISKDLFIFGEQIFATIVPEPQATQQQQQQQQRHTPVTATTPPTTTANGVTHPIDTAAAATAGHALVVVEPIQAVTVPTTTTTTKTPSSKQETLTVVVVGAASKTKLQKIPKEAEEPQRPQQNGISKVKIATKLNSTEEDPQASATDHEVEEEEENEQLKPDIAEQQTLVKQQPAVKITKTPPTTKIVEQVTAFRTKSAPVTATNFENSPLLLVDKKPNQQQQQSELRVHQPVHCHIVCERIASEVPLDSTSKASNGIKTADRRDQQEIMNSMNMAKVLLGNNGRTDHAMVTLPFISEQQRTLQLTFQNINVLHNERKILSDVSGSVSPGEVLAIMGPSGSGKTTLLDCLSGQRRIDGGSIYLNREPLSKKWRRKICYVLQEEVFFSGLTLRETVMYTALLRLPDKMCRAEKVKLVDRILEALELNFCQQTKFGDYLNRGLSGGEKKRANIACELLTNPLLMLLDEPTSGLDSHSAISLMNVLKRYALQEQKTVVITVHQPSSQMFHMFDKLLLLYNGRTAYFGEVNNIYRYFEDIGVAIKPHYNPADFVLEQLKSFPDIREKLFIAAKESHCNFLNRNCITVNNTSNHQNSHHRSCQNGIIVTSANGTGLVVNDKSHQHDSLINDMINNYYKDIRNNHNCDVMLTMNDHHNSCEEASQQLWCGTDSQSNFSSASSDCQLPYESPNNWLDYPTRFGTQFSVLLSRSFKEAKPLMLSKLNWFQTIGLALMAGAIWLQIPRSEEFLHDLQGWMFFSQTYWMLFALFGALNSFPSEREVISKERRSGAYRLSAYYLAKMFAELPLVVTLPTVYLMISYPMLGCASFKLFFLMLVFLLLNTIVAQSVGFFIGACCMDMNVSITLSALYTLATQLFGGYLSSRIPKGLSWIRYTSMIHYAYQNMQILEFLEGPPIRCGNPSSYEVCKNSTTTFIPYTEILKAQNSTSPLWLNTLILIMFFVVFRGLGYAVLRYWRCPKT